jgi:hypothetical protein
LRRALVAVALGLLAAAPQAFATTPPGFTFPNPSTSFYSYAWSDAPSQGTNHGTVNPGEVFRFTAQNGQHFSDHWLIWDTSDPGLPDEKSSTLTTRDYTAPQQPGTYAFHCAFHDSLGMNGYIVVSQDQPTVSPPAGPSGSPNGPGDSPSTTPLDVTAPTVAFGARVTRIRHGKLAVNFSSSEGGTADVLLKRGRKKLGTGHVSFAVPGPHVIVAKLNKPARKALRHGTTKVTLVLSVADAAGNTQSARRTLRVREAA